MDQPINHYELNESLQSCGSSWNAGQVHGLLCSRLSVAGAGGARRWFAQVLDEADPGHARRAECETMLDELLAITWQQLAERQSEFVLLLPHDDDPIVQRTAAMGLWCEGYLHGLISEQRSDTLKERLAVPPLADVIKDMLQITRAIADDDESDESSFAELVEYLRVATELAFEELADFRGPDEGAFSNESSKLH